MWGWYFTTLKAEFKCFTLVMYGRIEITYFHLLEYGKAGYRGTSVANFGVLSSVGD